MSRFNGMVKVCNNKARRGALNCICYIERSRNAAFEERVQEFIDNFDWSDALVTNVMSFTSYMLTSFVITREDVIKYVYSEWYDGLYNDESLYHSHNIMKLVNVSSDGFVYLDPYQSHIISVFHKYDPKDITGDMVV